MPIKQHHLNYHPADLSAELGYLRHSLLTTLTCTTQLPILTSPLGVPKFGFYSCLDSSP